MNYLKPPRLGLRIGVVGNRDLSGIDKEALRHNIGNLLSLICQGVESLWKQYNLQSGTSLYSDETPRYFMINALAEGADQLAANVARELAYPFKLSCPIPFPIDAYKSYFMDNESREQFDRIISDSTLESTVIEMDCSIASSKYRQQGYRAAADMLLENADILIALYDPDRDGDMGGTQDTVRIARQRRIPVIHLNTYKPDQINFCRNLSRFEETPVKVTGQIIDDLLKSTVVPVAPKVNDAHSQQHSTCLDDIKHFFREPLLRDSGFSSWLTRFFNGFIRLHGNCCTVY